MQKLIMYGKDAIGRQESCLEDRRHGGENEFRVINPQCPHMMEARHLLS